jgi:hypothetical protein
MLFKVSSNALLCCTITNDGKSEVWSTWRESFWLDYQVSNMESGASMSLNFVSICYRTSVMLLRLNRHGI